MKLLEYRELVNEGIIPPERLILISKNDVKKWEYITDSNYNYEIEYQSKYSSGKIIIACRLYDQLSESKKKKLFKDVVITKFTTIERVNYGETSIKEEIDTVNR